MEKDKTEQSAGYGEFTFKRWEDLDITDDFIFSQVMQDEALCRPLVEKILGIKIGKIKYLNDQQEEKIAPCSHGIRMDIYLKDKDKIINVEMQTRNYNDLPQRARFYQSVGDVNSLEPSELYGELMDHYVIFICTFDLFSLDLPKYTFLYTCQESRDLLLNDGSCIIFMNTSASEKNAQNLDSDLKSFYDYIEKRGSAQKLAGKFNEAIALLKENDDKRRYYMTYTSRIMEAKIDGQKLGEKIGETRGINIGRTQGIDIGRTQGIDNTIAKFYKAGLSVADIAKATGLSDEQILNAVKSTEGGN
jgi:predicted transposase/invertase (TIGR01784 family)